MQHNNATESAIDKIMMIFADECAHFCIDQMNQWNIFSQTEISKLQSAEYDICRSNVFCSDQDG